jgi:peptidylprolyl isomerase
MPYFFVFFSVINLVPVPKERAMTKAKLGDKVKVHYSGILSDGKVFDSSFDRDPLEFTVGEEKLIPGFEIAVVGMQQGETKSVIIASKEAYGPHQKDLVAVIDKATLPPHVIPKVGLRLQVASGEGVPIVFTISAFDDKKVTLDANHPLAGKDLTFEIKLLEIG